MNILIVRVSAIGDVIHTLPAVFYLNEVYPHAKISWVVQKKAASLLVGQPFLDRVYTLENAFLAPKNLLTTLKTVWDIRRTKWDAILDFQGILKSSILLMSIPGRRFGFCYDEARLGLTCLLTRYRVKPAYKNIIQKNLALASSLSKSPHLHVAQNIKHLYSCPSLETIKQACDLSVPDDKEQEVESWLKKQNISNFIILSPNTTWDSKHWPAASWKSLVEKLSKTMPSTALVIVGSQFGGQARELEKYFPKTLYVTPPWDLLTLATLIKQSSLLIAPDTGVLHLADFLGTQTIGIFGPTSAHQHGPFLHGFNMKTCIQIPCSHYYEKKHLNKEKVEDCMKKLSPDQLFDKIEAILIQATPSDRLQAKSSLVYLKA